MEGIKKYLRRHKGLVPPQESAKRLCIEIIQNECGISLGEKELSIRNGGVHLSCHPTVRSEVIHNAPIILSTLCQKHNVRISYIR